MRFIALFPDGVLRYYLCVVRIAAQPQHMVKLRLRNGKSEGRLRNALRFFYGCNLFRFGGEKG